jgi:hypothetical protein
MAPSQPKSFKFIIQNPIERFNLQTQRIIRRHAATRCEPNCASELTSTKNPGSETVDDSSSESSVPRYPHSGLHLQARNRELDFTNLSALTCLHVGEVFVCASRNDLGIRELTCHELVGPHGFYQRSPAFSRMCCCVDRPRTSPLYRHDSGTQGFLTMLSAVLLLWQTSSYTLTIN